MTQLQQINELYEDLADLTGRTHIVRQVQRCGGLDVEAIYGSQLGTIKLALGRAKAEALLYASRPRTWSECWKDLWGIEHLPEHTRSMDMLSRLVAVVNAMEREFTPARSKRMTRDDALSIIYRLKRSLETDPNLLQGDTYEGLVP